MASVPQKTASPAGDVTVITMMTKAEAKAAERKIIATSKELRNLVVDFHERRGWDTLGHKSFTEWVASIASHLGYNPSRLFQELTAGLIERQLTNVSGALPESHLRPLAPLRDDPDALRETWQRANEMADSEGKERAARHVKQAVQERTSPAPDLASEPLDPFEETILAQLEAQHTTAPTPQTPAPMAVHFSSATPEWYTPLHIVDMVDGFFGGIDLDPCSNAKGEAAHVPARYHYTREDDGLAQSWRVSARDNRNEVYIYMNPPYGDEIVSWVERLVRAYTTGEIDEAIALLPARTDTGWWRKLRAHSVCFLQGRLKFVGAENGAPFPSVLVYLGPNLGLFVESFEDYGIVYTPHPRISPYPES